MRAYALVSICVRESSVTEGLRSCLSWEWQWAKRSRLQMAVADSARDRRLRSVHHAGCIFRYIVALATQHNGAPNAKSKPLRLEQDQSEVA